MPTKNVYVTESDLPLFTRAAELAGGMSAAVAAGLRLYVAQEDRRRKEQEMTTIEVNVDDGALTTTKRFQGHQLLRWSQSQDKRVHSARVYLTARGQYAVYLRDDPDWSARSSASDDDWDDPAAQDGTWWRRGPRQLLVFPDVEAMIGRLPDNLVEAVRARKDQPAVEDLDI